MITVDENNKQTVIDKYGNEVYDEIRNITDIINTVHKNKISRTMLFESYAHDNLRKIQHNYMVFPDVDYHNHNFYEFTHVLEGAVIEILADKSYIIEQGETIILSPSVTHSFHVLPDTKHASFFIKNDWFCEMGNIFKNSDPNNYISNLCSKNIFTIFQDVDNDEYNKKLSRMLDIQRTVYRSTGLYDNLHYENLFSKILIELARQKRTDFSYFSEKYDTDNSAQIILQYIIDNYNRITAEDVAKHFGFSRTHIFRILKNYTGVSFTRHIAEERMKQAKLLLLNTRLPISAIVTELGFKNSDSFSKAFKKRRHITPYQYRKFNQHVGKLRSTDVPYKFSR